MSYTCKDCKVQCIERSREYICTSFKLGEPSDSSVRCKRQFGIKTIPQNQKAVIRPLRTSQEVLKNVKS